MRIILKIIAAPFVLALILAVAVLSFLSCIAGALCWLACTVFVLLAACGFFAGLHAGRRGFSRRPLFVYLEEVSLRPQHA